MKILVFAPHPDDEVLGCGGAMARYIAEGAEVTVCIVTSPQPPVYNNDIAVENGWPHKIYPQIKAAHDLLGVAETAFLQFPCVLLENEPRHIVNGKISETVQRVKPDVVFIPHFGDMQKDHAIVSEAVMVAVRPKYKHIPRFVYSYECLSETEWNIPHAANIFIPNTFIDISDYLKKKLQAMACFTSQVGDFPNPRSIEAVEALARLRGSAAGFKAAEAFSLIREYRGGR
ncbi:MAG: PIG-L family deacetylase [Clostridia bacterium]|nr:PIG-L family deacetylase [Clostridia bacterium]